MTLARDGLTKQQIHPATAVAIVLALVGSALPARAGAPTDIDTYSLFARDLLRTKGIKIDQGNVGVNAGVLHNARGGIIGPNSALVATSVSIASSSVCSALFANKIDQTGPACAPSGGVPVPLIADVPAACGFPDPFPTCDDANPVNVPAGQTLVLPSGVYGDLRVRSANVLPSKVVFTGGSYVFCSFSASKAADLRFVAPADVAVAGMIRLGAGSHTLPEPGLSAKDVRFFSNGDLVRFSRDSAVAAKLCAPEATLKLTKGTTIQGNYVARVITTEQVTVPTTTIPLPTTSTATTPSSTSTTTTTLPLCPCSGSSGSTSTISSNFNGTPISQGNFIWFNSVLDVSGIANPLLNPVTIHVTGQTITFTANATPFSLSVPDATVTIDPSAALATTTFNNGTSTWQTVVQPNLAGNTFMSGLAFQVPPPSDFPGGINPVSWSATFTTDTNGVNISWQWAAAVYTSFSTDNNALGVKPVDDNMASIYMNSDHAGTPENFKTFVTGGARGGGGSNFTGSYSATAAVTCTCS